MHQFILSLLMLCSLSEVTAQTYEFKVNTDKIIDRHTQFWKASGTDLLYYLAEKPSGHACNASDPLRLRPALAAGGCLPNGSAGNRDNQSVFRGADSTAGVLYKGSPLRVCMTVAATGWSDSISAQVPAVAGTPWAQPLGGIPPASRHLSF
jgi:hypothetical protein